MLPNGFHMTLNIFPENIKSWSWQIIDTNGTIVPLVSIGPIMPINIFIGPSGSGKSRLMKEIMATDKIVFSESKESSASIFNFVNSAVNLRIITIDADNSKLIRSNNRGRKEVSDISLVLHELFKAGKSSVIKHKVEEFISHLRSSFSYPGTNEEHRNSKESLKIMSEFVNHIPNIKDASGIKRVYMPSVRTAERIVSSDTMYQTEYQSLKRTMLERDNHSFASIDVGSGVDMYDSVASKSRMLAGERNNLREFSSFISKLLFKGDYIELTAAKGVSLGLDNQLLLYIQSSRSSYEQERVLKDYGEGIESLIIMMYNIWMAENRSWVFIEEPETHMHPHLQRIFFQEFLCSEAISKKGLVVFMTTHSTHFLSMAIERVDVASVFSFYRLEAPNESDENFIVTAVSSRDQMLLHNLGVQNSSAFLANCSIWVEGIDDRRYCRSYLSALLELIRKNGSYNGRNISQLREGLHYAFFDYGGSNIVHYIFGDEEPLDEDSITAKDISNKIFLLADQDSGLGKERLHEKRRGLQSRFFRYRTTVVREIENTLSSVLLENALKSNSGIKSAWPNGVSLEHDEFKNSGLGGYLETTLSGIRKFSEKLKEDERSERLNHTYKRMLSEYIAKGVDWSDMSDCARELATDIYDFIVYHNYGIAPVDKWWTE